MEYFIKIAKDFSKTPGSRHRDEGPFSGQEFYDTLLLPKFSAALQDKRLLTVDLDGTLGFATSFLSEAFYRLSEKFGQSVVLDNIVIISNEEPYLVEEIKEYIEDAAQPAQ